MSADNTVIVLRTPSNHRAGYEYRVAQVRARENANSRDGRIVRRWMVEEFAQSQVFSVDEPNGMSAEEQAWEAARAMAAEIRRVGVLEYGIRSMALAKRFG